MILFYPTHPLLRCMYCGQPMPVRRRGEGTPLESWWAYKRRKFCSKTCTSRHIHQWIERDGNTGYRFTGERAVWLPEHFTRLVGLSSAPPVARKRDVFRKKSWTQHNSFRCLARRLSLLAQQRFDASLAALRYKFSVDSRKLISLSEFLVLLQDMESEDEAFDIVWLFALRSDAAQECAFLFEQDRRMLHPLLPEPLGGWFRSAVYAKFPALRPDRTDVMEWQNRRKPSLKYPRARTMIDG